MNDKQHRFRREYRDAEIYLSRKVLIGRRRKLSLRKIAEALELPIADVENAWNILLQDAR